MIQFKSRVVSVKESFLIFIGFLMAWGLVESILQAVNYPPRSNPKKTEQKTITRTAVYDYDPHTAFRFKSGLERRQKGPEFDVLLQTNGWGHRDDPIKEKQGKRILVLGDSMTAGLGVSRPYIFADVMQSRLEMDVVNAGNPGWEIIHQAQFLKYYGERYAPDVVVFVLYLGNDLVRNGNWATVNGELVNRYTSPLIQRDEDFRSVQLLKQAYWKVKFHLSKMKRRRAKKKEKPLKPGELREWRPYRQYVNLLEKKLGNEARTHYEESKHYLEVVSQEVRNLGSQFLLVLLPYRTPVEVEARKRFLDAVKTPSDYDLLRPQAEIISWSRTHRVSYLDLTPILKKQHHVQQQPLYFYHDGHLNRRGHQVVGKAISDHLLKWSSEKGGFFGKT